MCCASVESYVRGIFSSTTLVLDRDRLGEVPWLVHVEAAQDGEVVAQQLQGHDVHYGLQAVRHLWHLHTASSRS